MLATRIIPTLLCRGRTLVKGKQFRSWRSVGVVTQAVRVFQQRGADELILIDIGATPDNRPVDLELVTELADMTFMPLAIGGGVHDVDTALALLRAGADKVVIGQALYKDPYLACKIADRVGSQAVVAAIDTFNGNVVTECGATPRPVDPAAYATVLQTMGVGEVMITDVPREGMGEGYNLESIQAVSKAVDVPVIAHGGAGEYNHMLQAIIAGASAVAAGSLYQFMDATPKGAAQYLHEQGVLVRYEEDKANGNTSGGD